MRTVITLAVALALTACGDMAGAMMDREFTVRVTGDAGTPYSGSYMTTSAAGTAESQSIEGTVPREYNLRGNIVSVGFQKQKEDGRLEVEIIRDGEVVARSGTSAAYGMVTAASQ